MLSFLNWFPNVSIYDKSPNDSDNDEVFEESKTNLKNFETKFVPDQLKGTQTNFENCSEINLNKSENESSNEILKFCKLSEKAITPSKGSENSAGFDLYSVENVIISPKSIIVVKTDLMIELPIGTYGRIAPRSGLSLKGIDILAGVIDRDYRGEIKIVLINFSNDIFEITEGMKIAQLICEKISNPKLLETINLSETLRNDGGFGSTGL